MYSSPTECRTVLENSFRDKWSKKLVDARQKDADSRLGVYFLVNPNLIAAKTNHIPEFERILITRYCCGSHYLAIEKDRMQGRDRENRLCSCRKVQTLHHIIFECPLVDKPIQVTSLNEFFDLNR